MTVRLDGKVVLITGVTAGIGRALASLLCERGARVVGMARRKEVGESLAAEIQRSGSEFYFVKGDVGDPRDCAGAVSTTLERFGRIDVLINNAAVMEPVQRVEAIADVDWRAIMSTTLDGVFQMSRAVLPIMQKQKDGLILLVSSSSSEQAVAEAAAYTSAKAAANHLMRTIAVENLAHGVRANTALLGVVATEMMSNAMVAMGRSVRGPDWLPDSAKSGSAAAAMLMEPQAVARAVALLCSDDGREINGATIAIDRAFSVGSLNSMTMYLAAGQLLPA